MIPWGVWFEPVMPVRDLAALARLAEDRGASACFVADEGTERDVYVALTAVLLATDAWATVQRVLYGYGLGIVVSVPLVGCSGR